LASVIFGDWSDHQTSWMFLSFLSRWYRYIICGDTSDSDPIIQVGYRWVYYPINVLWPHYLGTKKPQPRLGRL